jgi:hypothetical protein
MTFDIHQMIFNEYGEYLEEQGNDYINQVVALFDASPEGQALVTQGIESGWTSMILDYGFRYLGVAVPDMGGDVLREILFGLIPEKVVTEPSSAPEIVTESRAFWNFVKREFELSNADNCLELLNRRGIIEDLRMSLDNPAQYGMSKSIIMEGMRRGFDVSTKEGMEQWFIIYNQEAAARMKNAPPSPTRFSGPPGQDWDYLDASVTSRGRPKIDKKKKSKRKMEKASRKKNRRR